MLEQLLGQMPQITDRMPGIDAALVKNQQMSAQGPRGFGGGVGGGGLRDFLGAIGDALLVANGRPPMYQARRQERRKSAALQQFLGGIDPELAAMLSAGLDPSDAVALYKVKNPAGDDPETIRLMRAAGIDPASEEGRTILKSKLIGRGENEPNFIRELEALGIDPGSDEARELYYGRNSPAGYLLKPRSRESGDIPTVNTQEEYDALPPGAKYRDSQGNPAIKRGGPAASPPATFP